METEINVESSMRESKENEFAPGNRSNDDKIKTHGEIIEGEMVSTTKNSNLANTSKENSIDLTKNCTDDSFEDLSSVPSTTTFKKPTVLIGCKRFRSINKTPKTSVLMDEHSSGNSDCCSDHFIKSQEHPKDPPFPYMEPPWGGKSEQNYKMEVLKSGVIIETISLNEQSFYVIGRLPSCHISLAHPTISRYHAVLQYRSEEDKENAKGYYIYDLGSTHGTFWNGNRIKPNIYVRVQGGHMLRFGCSQRKYILQAPLDDQEAESQYTLFELKEMRASELEKRCANKEVEASVADEENNGIDWGMREDADEETDLQENPYACITDEDLVLEDPKKTLRGWFEREGYNLQYETEEKGFGQFLCRVELPMEDIVGHTVRAEALVKGKKKEAVVQCALEACKILDKYGLLRQANHEARKRKTRNWEAEDYYDSDEDNFLDRTGSVEKKREQRMRLAGKLEDKVETYDSLFEKHTEVTKRISHLSNLIKNWQNANNTKKETTEEDALDAFMSSLNSHALTKSDIAKMKLELQNLRKEEASLIKLLNLTRPANLPALASFKINTDQITHQSKTTAHVTQQTSSEVSKIQGSLFRRRKEKQINQRVDTCRKSFVVNTAINAETNAESVEELDSDDNDMVLNSSDTSLNKESSETRRSTGSITATTNESFRENDEKQQKYEITATKKRRQEQRKVYYDQDTHADNYSTWVPPQDQAGDGKTSLNEKYGY